MIELTKEIRELRHKIVGLVLPLTVEIEYAEGYDKKILMAKYEAYKDIWQLVGGDIPVEEYYDNEDQIH